MASYFKYKTPTPIQGTPTYKAFNRLKVELRANASSVETDLGGGNHGYLRLVLSDAEYANISPTPFVVPAYPAQLNISANATQVQAYKRLTRLLTKSYAIGSDTQHHLKSLQMKCKFKLSKGKRNMKKKNTYIMNART